MRPGDPRRALISAFGVGVLAAGSLATGAQAASLDVTFHLQPGACVEGVSNKTLTRVSLWDGPNDIDHVDGVVPDADGRFVLCFSADAAIVESGYRIVATAGTETVGWTVPPLSLLVDRVTDKLTGFSNANHALTLRAYDCDTTRASGTCSRKVTRRVTTNSSGHYVTDLSTSFDLRGFDTVQVTYATAHGHTFTLDQAVPYFEIFVGSQTVEGRVNPGQHTTLRLKSEPGGTLLSTRSATGDWPGGRFDVAFGARVRAGRLVTADLAGDARVTVPTMGTSLTIDHHDQLLTVRCLPNRRLIIAISAPHSALSRMADGHGRVTVNLSRAESEGFRLPHGSEIATACQTRAGEIIVYQATAP